MTDEEYRHYLKQHGTNRPAGHPVTVCVPNAHGKKAQTAIRNLKKARKVRDQRRKITLRPYFEPFVEESEC